MDNYTIRNATKADTDTIASIARKAYWKMA